MRQALGVNYTLVASSSGLTGATSSAFNITVGTPAKLALTVQPSNTVAGGSISPAVQVEIRDDFGNKVANSTSSVTVAIGSNPGGGTLSGTTPVNASAGVATFADLAIDTPGTGFTLVASASGLTGATSSSFNITTGAAAKLAFVEQPSNTVAGGSISPAVRVEVQDASGNTVTDATNSIAIAIGTDPGGGSISGTTPVNATSGVATFADLSIDKVGVGYTLVASASGLSGATSSSFNITAGTPAKLAFTVQPSNTAAGGSISPAVNVEVQDDFSNKIANATSSVTIAIGTDPGGGTLSATPVNAASGVATFSDLSLDKVGVGYTLAVSASGLTGATSSPFNITAGAAAKLAFTAQPSDSVAGASISPTVVVEVQDSFSNKIANGTSSVTIAIGANPGGGTLSGTTSVIATSGVATFSDLSVDKTGVGYTLVASASSLTGAASSAFTITAGTPSKLAFLVQPSNTVAGGSIAPAVGVDVQDALGNAVSAANDSITVAIGANPGGGSLSGTIPVNAVSGVATFSDLSIDKFGVDYTLLASASGLAGATSAEFNITAGPAANLAFTVQPSNTLVGTSISPAAQVEVQDALGNIVTTSNASITIAIGANPGGGTLSGTTPVNAVGGVATFPDLSIDEVGSGYTLVASASGLGMATSTDPKYRRFNIAVGAPVKLAFKVQPGNTVVDDTISPAVQVEVQDALGNTVAVATDNINMAIDNNPSGGTLSGTTQVNAVGGVAIFSNLSIDEAGAGYTLVATASGLTLATSSAFSVSINAASKLAFKVQPSNTVAGDSPTVQVEVQDSLCIQVADATNSITMVIGINAGGGTLSGTNPVNAVNGVATFSDLSIDKAGVGYTLVATGSGLTGATSSVFNIAAGQPVMLAFTVQPSNSLAGTSISPAVQVGIQDAQGNTVTTANDGISIAIGTNPAGGHLSRTTLENAVNGVAAFSDLSIDNTGVGYTLVASASGLIGATSTGFNLTIDSVPGVAGWGLLALALLLLATSDVWRFHRLANPFKMGSAN